MSTDVLAGYVWVAVFGAYLCIGPLVFRPSVQFGVRVPAAHRRAPVIRRQRRAYLWRSALIAILAAAVLLCLTSHTARWPGRAVFAVEVAADLVCFWRAHRQIARVKAAEGWSAGRRQTVVADTSWRTRPEAFPARWLIPAIAVTIATVVVGIVRYPQLSVAVARTGDQAPLVGVFAFVAGQLYVTALWTVLLLLVYRSRPDLEVEDPIGSLRCYRAALGTVARAGLVLLAGVDAAVFLRALQVWQLLPTAGVVNALIVLPPAAGLVGLLATLVRAARTRSRTVSLRPVADRDDDRFWKAGLVYVNREDPAVLVGARTSFGWTFNLGNPAAWMLLAGWAAVLAGLVTIRFTVGI